ncbi:MAG: hypothetical protein LBU34_04670 [Planctomycetaceae bacterium]|nr:hypothetical protein [Planctomycetaceae bacterium]
MHITPLAGLRFHFLPTCRHLQDMISLIVLINNSRGGNPSPKSCAAYHYSQSTIP